MNKIFFKQTKKVSTFKIAAPKLQGVKTTGYINLFSKRRAEVETVKRTVIVKVYKSRKALKFAQVKATMYKAAKAVKLAGQAFIQVCLMESTVNRAKQALQDSRRAAMDTAQTFPLYVAYIKAIGSINAFKFSLPKPIRLNLF